MIFNIRKFLQGTRDSNYYQNWEPELLRILGEAGCKYPEYDYNAHHFVFSVRKNALDEDWNKRGRWKRFEVVCPNEGDIYFNFPKRADAEEMRLGMEQIANFISVMVAHGYIIPSKKEATND